MSDQPTTPALPDPPTSRMTMRLWINNLVHSGNAVNRTGQINLNAAYAGGANKEWASATPSANLTATLNKDALAWFEAAQDAGCDIHVTLEAVPRQDA